MSIKSIFWDFDGVILDSMHIRDVGFIRILSAFPHNAIDELIRYHRENGGLSRYHKIRYFFEQILGEPISEEEVNRYADAFSNIMREMLVDPANLIQDANLFIAKHYKDYEFHIVSGSDQNELRFLCSKLNLSQYFKSINGSPTVKNKLVAELLGEVPYSIDEICLIGDSQNDFDAASLNGISFWGYNNPSLKEKGYNYIESFSELKHI
ncbi:Phosphoglycolate phosphatase, HAD superfamily [Chitinophaga ginsengisegetis]|uniref:phosphoglycolate phosphatase n=1 Tax=Chitinophaga ginsengisegetis TaxID=393003 RepID=A0A1T5P5D0_9BACT|nr:HAD hydrolase-like protein [Chitinophaga ginsengisegetis]SKD07912.1 Phosphoglycolate phosphatase, HAD superfamily [Chitinophaga ginsengisegetis]